MSEPWINDTELKLYLDSLQAAVDQCQDLFENKVKFTGLPIEEWAGPGYAVAALFDPYVLTGKIGDTDIYLEAPETFDGLIIGANRPSGHENISFVAGSGRQAHFHLPELWGGVSYRPVEIISGWEKLGTLADFPAAVVRHGTAIFSFNPVRVIHRYLNMADCGITRDWTDFIVSVILAANGINRRLDDDDLRRDFHALGISAMLIAQMYAAAGRRLDMENLKTELHHAAAAYCENKRSEAQGILGRIFKSLEKAGKSIIDKPVFVMNFPHGGILFDGVGFAEYDCPDMAAKVLNMFMDFSEKYNYHFAPDIGAGTIEEFAKLHPETVQRLRNLWESGQVEMVNGTYSQPYLQLWPLADQYQQFEFGLAVFVRIFGRRPVTYAAQELALHPALPDILCHFQYQYAIHRSQNMGAAPIDDTPMINWTSPSGNSIPALPNHSLRSERRSSAMYRHFPVMLSAAAGNDIPFVAMTNFMDQTFIDIYFEELVRAGRYAEIIGKFVTPQEFFCLTGSLNRIPRVYHLDQYDYKLELKNGIHNGQTGGQSSIIGFLEKERRRLQSGGDQASWKYFLNQQAHDSYILPRFPNGYFMSGLLTDYCGPNHPDILIRQVVGYPECFADELHGPTEPMPSDLVINHQNGEVVMLNGRTVAFGRICYNNAEFMVNKVVQKESSLKLYGELPGFGPVELTYSVRKGFLYCEIRSSARISGDDEVRLEHIKLPDEAVTRQITSIWEQTKLNYFHSLSGIKIGSRKFVHGGNIFFRQNNTKLFNLLWRNGDFSEIFFWGVEL